MKKSILFIMAAAAVMMASCCNNGKKAPSEAQIKADSLALVQARYDSVIAAKNAALAEAYSAGDDAAIAAAAQELVALQAEEEANAKALEALQAQIAEELAAEDAAAKEDDETEETTDDAVAEEAEATNPEVAGADETLPEIGVATVEQPAAKEIEKDEAGNEVIAYQLVETKPSFKGGDANSFSKWVGSHIEYPEEAKEAMAQGTTILKFRVNTDGKVSNVEVLRGCNEALDAEAVRVVKSSPNWTAGQQGGSAVPVNYIFPVVFKLQ